MTGGREGRVPRGSPGVAATEDDVSGGPASVAGPSRGQTAQGGGREGLADPLPSGKQAGAAGGGRAWMHQGGC